MSLTYKILLSVLIPLIFLSSFFFFTIRNASNEYLFKTFKEKQLQDLRFVEKLIEKDIQNMTKFLSPAADMLTYSYKNKKDIQNILNLFRTKEENINSLYFINKYGKITVISGKNKNIKNLNMDKSNIFLQPVKNKKIYLSDFLPDKKRVKPTYDISIPVINKSKIVGVLWANINAGNFYSLMKYYTPKEGVFVLADLDIEEPIIRIRIPHNLNVNCNKLIESVKFSKKNQDTFTIQLDNLPFTVIFDRIKLNNINFALISLKSNRTLYYFKDTLLKKHLTTVLPGLFIIMLFIIWRIKSITKPLTILTNEIKELSFKYNKNDESKSEKEPDIKDEIKLLEISFNNLKDKIDNFSKEIININQELGSCIEKTEDENHNLEKIVNKRVQQIKYQVYHDMLTGLPNRRLFNDRLEMAIAYSARSKRSLSILFLDLDDFKNINDTLGHQSGDIFLKEVAKRLTSCCRSEDTVARFGGDEFVIILPDAQTKEDATEVAKRILKKILEPFYIKDNYITTSTSIGIAQYPKDGKTPSELLRNADLAMYSAKKKGKNQHVFFEQKMNKNIINKIAIENSLRKAVERDEFKILYQPKVNLKTGLITGVEALVRWQKDEDTLVPPGEFIFIAEESDIICMIGEWVLKKACQDLLKIHRYGFPKLTVAVNISARQFQDPQFVTTTKEILEKTGLDPKFLNIEITENTVMNDLKLAIEIMKKFNELNVKISIDDFGTGYSSLNYLKKFPVHALKIDRSFVKDIPNNLEDVAIAKSIMSLAHSLYLDVVAEGVERWEHLKFLKEHGCDEIQGRFVSMPISAPQLLQMLRKGPVLI